ncbi:hypothetical protein FPV67DRAFT_1465820 [Lyophyllum atratum]|nr:hypothetical protein FPV67DRAFT_1465820 [Lyophyllum atratum]
MVIYAISLLSRILCMALGLSSCAHDVTCRLSVTATTYRCATGALACARRHSPGLGPGISVDEQAFYDHYITTSTSPDQT